MLWLKVAVLFVAIAACSLYTTYGYNQVLDENLKVSTQQLAHPELQTQLRDSQFVRSNGHVLAWFGVFFLGILMFASDIKNLAKFGMKTLSIFLICCVFCGCYKPFEPNQLEVINNNEIGFMLPLLGDPEAQSSTSNEDFLKKNLVFTQQVRIPQQWVSLGYETTRWNGEWRPAAKLMKVDVSPVTREWTADSNSGTSNRNEAIWVMTADQVEFSTGWTCTARIASREDAAKFLHNYPNGALQMVMDHEIRAYLQAAFGIEVTDLPMDELRKAATPHISKVAERVKVFFKERGIQITNLGITGGFVYKNESIQQRMVEIFNVEQEKTIRIAKTQAQDEENKKLKSEADGKARALLIEKEAEAKGIKLVADAKAYEMQKAKESAATYMGLKQMELQKAQIEKWNGQFPTFFMSPGVSNPNMLLQVPMPKETK